MKLHLLCALALLAACASTPTPAAAPSFAPEAQLTALLEERRQALHIPGMAFVVVQDGRVVYAHAFGERDIASHAPVTLHTLFPIGSATKSFTSMAAALSQDAGVLTFDDHPQRFLPYFRMADAEANANVTLRDMLSHRTGLMAKNDLATVSTALTREDYIRAAGGAEPTAPFRQRFQYSNVMFTAAGEAVAAANHTTWENLIATRILAPLGMRESVANVRDMAATPDHVTGYVWNGAAWIATPPTSSLQPMAPAGSIASSADDMARWLLMLTNSGEIDGHRFVSEGAFRELTTPVMHMNATISYAMGWGVYDWNGLHVVEHNGGGEGIAALVSFIPERRTGFVLLSNTSPHDLTTISHAGAQIYPLLLGPAVPPPQTSATLPGATQPANGPTIAADVSLDALLPRMIRAAGGERALRRHTSLSIEAAKSYDNEGVSAALTIHARAPAAHTEEEVWSAAGREIGRLRLYFDGAHGGQETTFGQDAANDAAADAGARRVNDFRLLLHLRALYPDARLERADPVDGEEQFALRLGDNVTLYVSRRTSRVAQRVAPGEIDDYSDYRQVDGEWIPFRTVIHDALGKTTIVVNSARFNAPIPDAAFAPQR